MFIKVTEYDGELAIIPTKDIKSVRRSTSNEIESTEIKDSFKHFEYATYLSYGDGEIGIYIHETIDEVYASIEKAVRLIRPINIG